MHSDKPSGQQLVMDFQTAMVSLSTSQAASFEATRSENELVDHLRAVSSGSYLQPTALAADNQDALTRASLDAHIKKVQADQINTMNAQQLYELQERTQKLYAGKSVIVTVRVPELQPIETVWFDQQNGYRTNVSRKQTVKGKISDILLEKNAIIVKPGTLGKLLISNLDSYVVYMIDPQTCQPLVDVSLR